MFTTSNMVALMKLFWSFVDADNGIYNGPHVPKYLISSICLLMALFAIIIFIFIIFINAITNFLHYIACAPIKIYLQASGWRKKGDNKIAIQLDKGELLVMLIVCEGMDYFAMYYGGCVFKLKQ
jgi:hypothetical protein